MDAFAVINWAIAIIGAATGTSGLVLGILNYWRDSPNIQVTLAWDMIPYGGAKAVYGDAPQGVVSVVNLGRRPIYVSKVHLGLRGKPNFSLVSEQIFYGQKLSEGDPPWQVIIPSKGLEPYANDWKKIHAVVIDSAGKVYYSQAVQKRPSWSDKAV